MSCISWKGRAGRIVFPIILAVCASAACRAESTGQPLDEELAGAHRQMALMKARIEQAKQELELENARVALEAARAHGAAVLPQLPPPMGSMGNGGAAGSPPGMGGVDGSWLPVAIYGVDGRLKARLRAGNGAMLAEVAPGDTLPDGAQVSGIVPGRVSFVRGQSKWSLAVLRYGKEAFKESMGMGGRQ